MVATQMSQVRVEKIQELKIPTIDLSGKESHVSKMIVEACEEYGFFKVINHGVPLGIIKKMQEESFEFFGKPLPEKQRVGSANNPFGYGNKNIGLSGDTGELEYLLLETNHNSIRNISKLISNDPSTFSDGVIKYVEAMKKLACGILGLMAKGIGAPFSHFTSLLKDSDSDSVFRLNHYPPVCQRSNATIGFGEHSDPQILTLLASNGIPGLQVWLPKKGLWLPVTPDPHAFCVIVGDLLQVMTNERFKSARHRAMANSSSTESRLSMVFFGGPPLETTITCLPQLLELSKPIYKPFTWAEYKSHTYAHKLGDKRLDHFKLP